MLTRNLQLQLDNIRFIATESNPSYSNSRTNIKGANKILSHSLPPTKAATPGVAKDKGRAKLVHFREYQYTVIMYEEKNNRPMWNGSIYLRK